MILHAPVFLRAETANIHEMLLKKHLLNMQGFDETSFSRLDNWEYFLQSSKWNRRTRSQISLVAVRWHLILGFLLSGPPGSQMRPEGSSCASSFLLAGLAGALSTK